MKSLQRKLSNLILYSRRFVAVKCLKEDSAGCLINCQLLFQAYYRQGVALQCLGRHGDALAAFSSGLAVDPKSNQLLSGLVEASLKSPLRSEYLFTGAVFN